MEKCITTSLSPLEILYNPLMNKGTAFTIEERRELGLLGLLPHHVSSMEEQVKRRYANFHSKKSNIERYKMLVDLQDRNEVLFFRLLHEYVEEMLAYIYTPTVGEASLAFSMHYNQTRGIYIPYALKDDLDEIIDNIPQEDVEVIVVTDGSRILGLGDMGAGGMVIPVGKLALYSLFGGIHPGKVLPVMIDMGTDNEELLADELYIGWRHPRVRGEEYFGFIDRFIQAIKKKYPNALLQWEDFEKAHARELLIKYRDEICSFNDDIQGTAGCVLAGLLAAVKTKGEQLSQQRVAILGAGSAGMGIASLIARALVQTGMSFEEARRNIYVVDRHGLLIEGHKEPDEVQNKFLHLKADLKGWEVANSGSVSLMEVVRNAKINVLIGACAQPGIFGEALLEQMGKNDQRPIIFPLSNPTSKAEARPEDILRVTDGRAIIATGSPFEAVSLGGKTYPISQGNNVYIFPAIGLAAAAVKANKILPEMFLKAADVLSSLALELRQDESMLFPRFKDLRFATRKMAIEIAQMAIDKGLAKDTSGSAEELVDRVMWFPEYQTYCRKDASKDS
ncbi:MAG: NAD-dependent malic enzyme [Simkaniaceae bacterium]|nr:NAD-dependent malic enzyme [Simkaniaceae bacterium]